MQDSLRSNWQIAEFFTYFHRISGRVDIRQLKLADQLNSRSSGFLHLEEAYVSSVERPAEIIADCRETFLRKDRIIAVIVPKEDDVLPRERTYGAYLGTSLVKAFMTVPTFEIRGHVRLSSRMDLRVVLTTGTDDFIPVLNAEMRSAVHEGLIFASSAMLVNKQHIEAFWVEQKGQAGDGARPGN